MSAPSLPSAPEGESGDRSLRRGVARVSLLLLVTVAVVGGVAVVAGWGPVGGVWGLIASQHDRVMAVTAAYPLLSAMAYGVLYCLGVTLSLPGAVWMTLLAGYLFGPVWGGVLVFVAAVTGAVAVFLLARTAWGGALVARLDRSPACSGLAAGLRRHAFSTLLAARLIPVLPFWVVNLVPALIGVRLPVFVAATMLGIVPGTYIYVTLGAGLATLAEQPELGLGLLTRPEVIWPLLGLTVLAVLPVVWRIWRDRRFRRVEPPAA